MPADPVAPRDVLLARYEQQIRGNLGDVHRDVGADIYAIVLLLQSEDDLRPPELALGWNTETHLRSDPGARGDWYLSGRYNPGTWLQDAEGALGTDEDRELAEAALRACGVPADRPADESDEAAELQIAIDVAAARFVAELAGRLHDHGVLRDTLGRDVLVLCHTGKDSDPWTRLTLDANPPALHGDFKTYHDQDGVKDESF